jgi:hypothetical protein
MRYMHPAIAAVLFSVLLLAPSTARSAGTTDITIPAGTVIPVRMIDSIDSSQNVQGQTFRGSLDAPIHAGNQVVLPKGAQVHVRLVDVQSAGKLKGRSELELQLDRIVTQNATYTVHSDTIGLRGSSQGKKTGKSAGIGAIIGGGIGAIAGGGKGAAIGAGAGAGGGVGVQALRGGKPVRVDSESLLTFRLSAPLRVHAS